MLLKLHKAINRIKQVLQCSEILLQHLCFCPVQFTLSLFSTLLFFSIFVFVFICLA